MDDASFLVKVGSTSQDKQSSSLDSAKPLISYLPQCSNGSYLVTSRSKSSALQLVEMRNIITIPTMNDAEAILLFKNKLVNYGDVDCHDAAELVAELEFMPLAIVQATAYISQRTPRFSVQQYLETFRSNDKKKINLLNYDGGELRELRRDWEAKNSVMTTWQISFEHIKAIRPSAADLLSLMSFFDRQGIPERLLRSRSERRNAQHQQEYISVASAKQPFLSRLRSKLKFRLHEPRSLGVGSLGTNRRLAEVNSDAGYKNENEDDDPMFYPSDNFEEDVVILRNYSFILNNVSTATFEMHRLVQLATQNWLEAHEQQATWRTRFIRNLNTELPTAEYEHWAIWQSHLPHAKLAAAQRPEEQESLLDWASILYKTSWYMCRMGDLVEAEKMSIQAMKVQETILGQEHNDTLCSMQLLSDVYRLKGMGGAAERLQLKVFEASKRLLGQEHPDTLASMYSLALIYQSQGRWEEAEKMQIQVLEASKRLLGQEHPDTLKSMHSLALIYQSQGRWEEAEKMQIQVLEASKRLLGQEHPDTLTSTHNLALMYISQVRWEEAEKMQIQVLEASKSVLGQEHPYTLTSMYNLAYTWKDMGRDTDAVQLLSTCLEKSRERLGTDHPDTLLMAERYKEWTSE